jgi:hypothetical protein
MKTLVNVTTGEILYVPMTEEELSRLAPEGTLHPDQIAEIEAEAARQSARSKLAALGLTESEISALLGA